MIAALLNGQPASVEDLRALALVNYGHFSSMQVRGAAVQGLELHLRRLQSATHELFGNDLDLQRVREHMRYAVADSPDCSLRATVFSRQFDYRKPAEACEPDVLVSVTPAAIPSAQATRIKSFPFLRPLPHLKHVGTFPLFHYRRLAMQQGFDDALFVDAKGMIAEGSVWNIGLWDGQCVVWPKAPALRGTAERLLQDGLGTLSVEQSVREVGLVDLAAFPAAFTCNAGGVQMIAAVDETVFEGGRQVPGMLQEALQSQAWQVL